MQSPFVKTEAGSMPGFSIQSPRPAGANPADGFSIKEKIVELADVRVVYNAGKNNEAKALDGISLEIFPEEYVMFFGPSGCGKSTVLNIIAGLEVPSEGKVSVDGQDLSNLSAYELAKFHCRKTGMIFQSYNLITTLDVLDNIMLPQIFEKIKPSQRKELARSILKKLGIEDFESRLPQELSGGQQQRVGIARALINNPPIILADEAVGNLDSQSAKNVLEILNTLNIEDRKTIISVTHNPEHLYYADRVFYMKDGKIIKVEVNEQKKKVRGESKDGGIKKERTEIDLLLQAFPDLSAMQLHVMLAPFKAKMLVAYLLNSLESEEIKFMEQVITDRLLGRLSKEELLNIFDRPAEQGGLGLNKARAMKFSSVVEEVVEKADFIRMESLNFKDNRIEPIEETIDSLRKSLLEKFDGELTLDQVAALNKGIEYRILSKISRNEFQEYLDTPFDRGGVGLNKKSAKNLARKLEIIMLMRYGK